MCTIIPKIFLALAFIGADNHAIKMQATPHATMSESVYQTWLSNIERSHKLTLPNRVYWLNGAPGAGKGTQTKYICEQCGIKVSPVIMSDLLTSPEFQAKIKAGMLVDDASVVELLFIRLCELSNQDSVIVDGFPRTQTQEAFLKYLRDNRILERCGSSFYFVTLAVGEEHSIARQLHRGEEAKAHGEQVRNTDLDPALARKRYQTFVRETMPALELAQKDFGGVTVDVTAGIEDSRRQIGEALKKYKAQIK